MISGQHNIYLFKPANVGQFGLAMGAATFKPPAETCLEKVSFCLDYTNLSDILNQLFFPASKN